MTFCARTQAHLLENQHENTPNFFWNALKSLNSGQECSKMVWPHPLTKKPLDPNVWNSAGNSLKCRFIEDQDPNPAGSCIPALQLNTHTPSAFVCVTYKQCRDISASWITLTGLLEFYEDVSPPVQEASSLLSVPGTLQVLFGAPITWLLVAPSSLWRSLRLPKHKGVLPNSQLELMLNYQNHRDLEDWEASQRTAVPFRGLSSLFCTVCTSLTRAKLINRVNDQQIING